MTLRILVIALVSIFLIVAAIVALSEPGRPLYTLGNVRKSGYLTAFGFVKELPEDFLQPADQLLRIFPGNNSASQSEQNEVTEKYGSMLYIEYMPDKTYVHMSRAPKVGGKDTKISPSEWAGIVLRNCGHLMPNVPIRYCDATELPKSSKKTISGCNYDCAEAAMAIDGGAVEKEKSKKAINLRL